MRTWRGYAEAVTYTYHHYHATAQRKLLKGPSDFLLHSYGHIVTYSYVCQYSMKFDAQRHILQLDDVIMILRKYISLANIKIHKIKLGYSHISLLVVISIGLI